MDDSQSSDFLSNSMDVTCDSPEIMDTVPYDTLILRTKKSINESIHGGITKSSLSQFNVLLEDCSSCIIQTLDLITGLLVGSEVPYRTLTQYMDHAVSLLQMLSNYINAIVESVAVTCCTMKTFPVTTGNIVMAVFSHCRDSETLYGSHLRHVERQLKEMFRSCHELQVTYLTVLEKHFTFDLMDEEEQEILIKALDINLVIGEIVQTLDVKTMAEQWKAYTNICDKHSSFLSGRSIFQDCSKVICSMTVNNIRTALEADQEDKIVLRSLKIASFTIKILLKLCGIFQCSSGKNFAIVVELFMFINKYNCSYLELELKKSDKFINQMTAIVIHPSQLLLAELVSDSSFLQSCIQYNDESRNNNEMLGYVVLLASVIEKMLRKSDQMLFKFKYKIIKCIFDVLPKCHVYLSLGLKFPSKSSQQRTHGLYEHILIHTIALASTLSSEDYSSLEELIYGTVLGTECWSALFASDLWVVLSRNNRHLLVEQFVFLCKTYEKLESNKLFLHSPQKVHLTYTIAGLFHAMKTEDKITLYNRYDLALWTPVQVKHTPPEVQDKAIEDMINNLLTKFERVVSSDIQSEDEIMQMSQLMKGVATCRFVDDTFEDYVIKIWMKSCPKDRMVLSGGEMDKGSLWYLEHIEALAALTATMKSLFKDHGTLTKILHVICNIVELGNTELCLILMDLICLISLEIGNEIKNQLDSIMSQTFRGILRRTDNVIYFTLFRVLKSYSDHKNFEYVVSLIFSLDSSLHETYGPFLQDTNPNLDHWKSQVTSTDYSYVHKCVHKENTVVLSMSGSSAEFKEHSNNFDFADIDSLFEGGSDSEPASKKAKLANGSKMEEIISRLEQDASLLCCEKENVFSKDDVCRIQAVCDQLKNIIN